MNPICGGLRGYQGGCGPPPEAGTRGTAPAPDARAALPVSVATPTSIAAAASPGIMERSLLVIGVIPFPLMSVCGQPVVRRLRRQMNPPETTPIMTSATIPNAAAAAP